MSYASSFLCRLLEDGMSLGKGKSAAEDENAAGDVVGMGAAKNTRADPALAEKDAAADLGIRGAPNCRADTPAYPPALAYTP